MELLNRLTHDAEEAMRAKNEKTRDTLRLLLATIQNRSIEKQGKEGTHVLSDDEVMEVIRREVKKRKETALVYVQGKRDDLASQERAEALILEAYLPPQASEEEIDQVIQEVVALYPAPTMKDFGKAMGEVMKRLHGRAEGGDIGVRIKKAMQLA